MYLLCNRVQQALRCNSLEAEATTGPLSQLLGTQVRRLLRHRSKRGEGDCWERIEPRSFCDVEGLENFTMNHDVVVLWVSLCQKCERTGQAAFTHGRLHPAGA